MLFLKLRGVQPDETLVRSSESPNLSNHPLAA